MSGAGPGGGFCPPGAPGSNDQHVICNPDNHRDHLNQLRWTTETSKTCGMGSPPGRALDLPGLRVLQHINKDSDVEGLILGENRVEERVTISDTQEDRVDLRHSYSVHKHVCCHQLNAWYDAAGRVDPAALRRLLGPDRTERVIGWYRQRRNSERQMSMREKAVHRNLKAALRAPHVVFLLVTGGALTEEGSTHRAEYAAFLSADRQVPVVVSNLASLDLQAYWTASPPCSAPGYRRAVGRHSSELLDAGGQLAHVDAVNAMNRSLQDELQRACGAVVESERAAHAILADVRALRRKLGDGGRAKASKGNLAGRHFGCGGTSTCRSPPPAEDAATTSGNVRLQLGVAALFPRSPLLASCTLTLDAFPVPDAASSQVKPGSPRPAAGGKRPAGAPLAGKRKRRKGDTAK